MEPIQPKPLDDPRTGRPVESAGIGLDELRPNHAYPLTAMKRLLRKLKESTTWVGLAVVAQFLPIGLEELQIVWTAITAVAGAVLLFIDEPKTTREKDSEG